MWKTKAYFKFHVFLHIFHYNFLSLQFHIWFITFWIIVLYQWIFTSNVVFDIGYIEFNFDKILINDKPMLWVLLIISIAGKSFL